MKAPRRLMLDTNAVSRNLKGAPQSLRERLSAAPMAALCVSAITEGELRFGLARRPQAVRLAQTVEAFLARIDVMAWTAPPPPTTAICAPGWKRPARRWESSTP